MAFSTEQPPYDIIPEDEIKAQWSKLIKASRGGGGRVRPAAAAAISLIRWAEARLSAGTGKRTEAVSKGQVISCTSNYGGNSRKPYVGIEVDGALLTQLPPETARALGYNLILSAEAAEQDAFMVEFAEKEIGVPLPQAAQILGLFREWREKNTI